jgi:hemerythrin
LGIENSSSGVASVVTLSAGVAALVPASDQEPSVLFELADNALYEAKRAGRNRVVASEDETNSRSIAEPADDEN